MAEEIDSPANEPQSDETSVTRRARGRSSPVRPLGRDRVRPAPKKVKRRARRIRSRARPSRKHRAAAQPGHPHAWSAASSPPSPSPPTARGARPSRCRHPPAGRRRRRAVAASSPPTPPASELAREQLLGHDPGRDRPEEGRRGRCRRGRSRRGRALTPERSSSGLPVNIAHGLARQRRGALADPELHPRPRPLGLRLPPGRRPARLVRRAALRRRGRCRQRLAGELRRLRRRRLDRPRPRRPAVNTPLRSHDLRQPSGRRPVSTSQAGQLIGFVGSTGSSTACHLHFEMHINGGVVDPWAWLQANAG